MKQPDYLTDEALQALIDCAEQDMLQPPVTMKSEILARACSIDTAPATLKAVHPIPNWLELLAYSTKVVLATACAIALVFSISSNDLSLEALDSVSQHTAANEQHFDFSNYLTSQWEAIYHEQ